MNNLRFLFSIVFVSFLLYFTGNQKPDAVVIEKEEVVDLNEYSTQGHLLNGPFLNDTYNIAQEGEINYPEVTPDLIAALENNLQLLKYRKKNPAINAGNLLLSSDQLEDAIKLLISSQFDPSNLSEHFDAHQISGVNNDGNVKMTGYYSPVIKASRTKSSKFPYPIYSKPKHWDGPLPSREEIENGAFEGLGLEIGYAENKLDIYYMQLQGSGYVEYPDGTQELYAHAGSNRKPYSSIGQFMIREGMITPQFSSMKSIRNYIDCNKNLTDEILNSNESYVFFKPKKNQQTIGAGYVPLTPNVSVAVDKSLIPLGSCLLAAVPVLDERRRFSHHEFKYLLAQDVGGIIKGPGHIDVYKGIGNEAGQAASNLHHFGQLWLMTPKTSSKNLKN